MSGEAANALRPRFTGADAERAYKEWGANCGPGAAAAILGLTLDEIRPLFAAVGFESRHYTNPTMMLDVLRASGRGITYLAGKRLPSDPWPSWGLVRIQWEGPWMRPGVPPAARYRLTHWVGASRSGSGVGVFDINVVGTGPANDHDGWTTLQAWSEVVAPHLMEGIPRADGKWSATHSIEVGR